MSDEQHDFGQAELLGAEAIGQPGQRRFRLFARSPRGSASLWLEREQMEELAQALDRVLAEISGDLVLRPEGAPSGGRAPGAPSNFPDEPDVDFQVAQLVLGYDEERDALVLMAVPILLDDEGAPVLREDAEPRFAARLTRQQATRLSGHIASVLAAGRPRCPLCGAPLGPEHVCVKQNGHHQIELG
jgi:uncharacterized repeat protein (TIGR03847 family)